MERGRKEESVSSTSSDSLVRMARQPLSTLPLAQFITPLSTSPSKPTPLRQSASSLMTLNSLLPSPFLASTTPRAPAGPLATIYDRSTTSRGGASPSRSRQSTSSTPSRLIDQEEQQEQLPTDESTTVTPPRRLLDLFVESASKESKSPRQRVQSTQPEESAPGKSSMNSTHSVFDATDPKFTRVSMVVLFRRRERSCSPFPPYLVSASLT